MLSSAVPKCVAYSRTRRASGGLGVLVPRGSRLPPVTSAVGECACLGGGPCGTAKQSGNRLFAVIIWTNSLLRSFSFILNSLCQLLYFYRLSSDKERG